MGVIEAFAIGVLSWLIGLFCFACWGFAGAYGIKYGWETAKRKAVEKDAKEVVKAAEKMD